MKILDEESKGRSKLTGIVKRMDSRHATICNDVMLHIVFSFS